MEQEISQVAGVMERFGAWAADMGVLLFEAACTVIVGAILIRLGRKGLKKLLNMGIYGRQMDESRRQTISQLLINVYEGVAWFLVVVIALSKLNINVNSLLAVAGVGGIAVGFGAQSLVKDTLSGLFIFFENQFVVGDTVDLAGLSGTVEKMTLRVTELRSFEGDLHVIPNGEITLVTNHTRSFHRAVVDVQVEYEERLDKVIAALEKEMRACTGQIEGMNGTPECLGVVGLEESGVKIEIIADCAAKQHWAVERELRRRIKDCFDREGIAMARPQRVVHLKNEPNSPER